MDSSLKEKSYPRQMRESLRVFYLSQIEILEKIAIGAPLREVLEEIVRLVEDYSTGICSILLLDPESQRITHGAAPNLPPEFLSAIDGIRIGSSVGSCGTAAFMGKRIVVEDIEKDPLWEEYRRYALPHELRACWSSPIFSSNREVLGTFAVYYNVPRKPSRAELKWVDSATHLAAVALMKERSELALKRSEARYRQLMHTTHEGVITLDAEGFVTYANKRALEMLGYSLKELLGKSALEISQPSEREKVEEMLARRRLGINEQAEVQMKTKSNQDLFVIISCSPIFNESEEVEGMLGMLTDITERKKAESVLQKREAQLRTMFDGASMAMILVTPDFMPIKCNPAVEKILEFNFYDLELKSLLDLIHPIERAEILEKKSQLDAGIIDSYKADARLLKKCQDYVWTRLTVCQTVSTTDQKPNSIIMIEDLEQNRKIEKQFQAAEKLRALTFDTVADVLFYLTLESDGRFRFLSANKSFFIATGLRSEQVIGRLVQEVIPEPSLSLVLRKYQQAIEEKRSVKWEEITEYPAGKKYGEVIATPIFNDDGTCSGIVGSVHDITDQRLSDERIRRQAAILDHAHDAILLRSLDSTVLYWNQGATRLYGWTAQEAIGRKITELLYRDTTFFEEAQNEVIKKGDWTGEIHQFTKEGRPLVIEASWTLLKDPQGQPTGILAINTDITEKKKLRDQVSLVQRMESLGTFAGGIAHDFNNLLTAIIGNVNLAKRYVPNENRAHEKLAIAAAACTRATELVRRILTFSRQPEQERAELNLRNIADETTQLLRSISPAMIEIRTSFSDNIPAISGDASQIHQVIMNLATNSIQAMSDHGVLSIRVDTKTVQEPLMSVTGLLPAAEYVRLTVEDTGPGMSPATLERVFEPFFTTKASGQGTGLGLSVVHGIVREHGGGIFVSSHVSQGTTFEVYLPVSYEKRARPDSEDSLGIPQGQGQRILFVDDEESISDLGKQILEGSGYKVTVCIDPSEALNLFKASPEKFDALVSDFAMPHLSGLELTEAVLKVRPNLPILLISGYLRPEEELRARAIGIREVLGKPSSITEMLFALERIFHGQSKSSASVI